MSDTAQSVANYVQRLGRRDPTLEWINLFDKQLSDAELAELADCLLAHPDVVKRVYLGNNQLTDETGVKLARYLAASSTIRTLSFYRNQFGSATYLALAAALRVNSSLHFLNLHGNQAVDRTRIEVAFGEALRLNPDRSDSEWYLHSDMDEYPQLKATSEQLGHPTLQMVLVCALLPALIPVTASDLLPVSLEFAQ